MTGLMSVLGSKGDVASFPVNVCSAPGSGHSCVFMSRPSNTTHPASDCDRPGGRRREGACGVAVAVHSGRREAERRRLCRGRWQQGPLLQRSCPGRRELRRSAQQQRWCRAPRLGSQGIGRYVLVRLVRHEFFVARCARPRRNVLGHAAGPGRPSVNILLRQTACTPIAQGRRQARSSASTNVWSCRPSS